ncbi:NAD(P)-dependent glycerol-3-phosphate dehydrogenase [Lampropedia puyangensis]|uniref:Glycerol-3-phosphate dehydrogenase [NAD(P)+] n=1 Tax=Lampropedia puyangensis TaxID=1330072 RepID=A0A4S8FAD8_9BURK|nr:NAD(P)H-dependent glycerol-3-phosphate dehydrogenase [Lampropedia puyangensis]THU03785.1 NAD(P)-dependent glycerol-3-phosphate dehydrogenase [Lampropedia puyangensis]
MTTANRLSIAVLGAGAWGTAVAIAAAKHPAHHHVSLWVRDAQQAEQMRLQRRNPRYLDEVDFPDNLCIEEGNFSHLVMSADLVVLGTPVSALSDMLQTIAMLSPQAPVVWLCKGIEQTNGLLPHEVQLKAAPHLLCGVLSGPSFALEVARSQPTALVAASHDARVQALLIAAFHGNNMRVYGNTDLVGVEVGGAVKNVLAIATGICDGLDLGLNARAALITRGLAEMTRLGCALGGRPETFMGLSGVGDLVLTATGGLSRNRKVGLLLAQGQSLPEILATLGHVAEGVYCAHNVVQRAGQLGVEMPISAAVVQLLEGKTNAQELVQQLLERDPAIESLPSPPVH